jgi:hypothetical protein
MKKLVIALCLTCVLALTASAGEKGKKKHEMTAEQKAVMKDMLAKYDTNKDGKLDKKEHAKISAEDKAKMQKVGLGHKKNGGGATTEKSSDATTETK